MSHSSLNNTYIPFQTDINSFFLELINVVTPGSDTTIPNPNSQIIWGRSGKDSLLGFDPGTNQSEQQQIDFFLADGTEANFLFGGDSQGEWSDRFVLGDWQQPYYADGQGLNWGLNQFSLILDFNPNQDIIQLHGTSKDYKLISSPLGTAIFWQPSWDTVPDLITILPFVSDLSLEDNYFQFKGNTPPPGPIVEQTQQLGTPGYDVAVAPSTDSFGNVYVAGATTGSLAAPNAGSSDVWFAKYDSNGNPQWIQQFGSSNFDAPLNIATDKDGNTYLTGVTKGDLGGTNPEPGIYDIWLAKYDSDGNQVWMQQFGTNLIDTSFGMDIDDNGNVYLSGFGIQEEPGILSFQDNPWVAKYDSNGNPQWYQTFGTPNIDEGYDVAVSSDGNVYSTGWTVGDLGGTNAGLYDIWVAKHDNNGEPQWIQQFGTQDYEFPWAIDTDTQGNVYITGWTLGTLGQESAGSYDTWIAKYDSNGNQEWIQQFGTSGDDSPRGMEIDSNDNIFLTGYTDNDLGGSNSGSYDAWVAQYDSNGNQVWIQQFGTPELDYTYKLTVDNANHVYVTGFTEGSFGGINAGSNDAWIAKLDAETGNLQNFTGTPDGDLFTASPNVLL
ncbi:MAG: SBBP repeat-containing protein [Cyanobacteriota bacterium]